MKRIDVQSNSLNILLRKFLSKNKKPARKEFLAIFSIRNIKRAFKCFTENKVPSKTSIRVCSANQIESRLWNIITQVCSENHEVLNAVLKPDENGSISDHEVERAKSFNFRFCKQFFEKTEIQELHLAIVDLLFGNPDPILLVERFKLQCCTEKVHEIECSTKWSSLQEYLKNDFLRQYFVY